MQSKAVVIQQEAVEPIAAALTSSPHTNRFLYGSVVAVGGAKLSKQPLFSGNIRQSPRRRPHPNGFLSGHFHCVRLVFLFLLELVMMVAVVNDGKVFTLKRDR